MIDNTAIIICAVCRVPQSLPRFSPYEHSRKKPTCRECRYRKSRTYSARHGLAKLGPEVAPGHRSCGLCRTMLPESEFRKKGIGGLRDACIPCTRKRTALSSERIKAKNLASPPTVEGLKCCPGCKEVLALTSFCAQAAKVDGRDSRCRNCRRLGKSDENVRASIIRSRNKPENRTKSRIRNRVAAVRRLRAVPCWLSTEDARKNFRVYQERDRLFHETGIPHHVDHIIPLRGKEVVNGHVIEVWGLHVPWNLRAIPGKDNEDKGNKFIELSHKLFSEEFLDPSPVEEKEAA